MIIVVLDGYTLNPGDLTWDAIERIGELRVFDRTREAEILERAEYADIILTNKTPLNKETLEKLPNLKYIGVLATGYNVVDVEAAKKMGIVVTNIPAYGTDSVAQFTFALLLEMCHHVWAHNEEVRKGGWSKCQDFCFWNYPLIELAGKTMGIIGFGRIGQAVGRIAQSFGMKVYAYNRHKDKALENDTLKYVELDELLAESDVITLHCPLSESTRGIINKESIGRMKSGVVIINTSRGPMVVEEDLAEALNSGKVAGAAVDVLAVEPANAGNPLINAKNCIITPHIAWAPKETRQRLMDIAVDNLAKFLDGKPVNVV